MSFIKRYRTLIITFFAVIFSLFLCFLLSQYFLDTPSKIASFSAWLKDHELVFFLWRMVLLLAFFFLWPVLVRLKAKRGNWPKENLKMAINLRYYLVVFLLFLDLVFHLGSFL